LCGALLHVIMIRIVSEAGPIFSWKCCLRAEGLAWRLSLLRPSATCLVEAAALLLDGVCAILGSRRCTQQLPVL